MKQLVELYKRVIDWNTKAGVKDYKYDTLDWHRAVELQTRLLVEEATEAMEAAAYGDMKELLDGAVDSFVILVKLIDMLEKAEFDFVEACNEVMGNNDSKIFSSYYEAVEAKEQLEERDDQEYSIETAIYDGLPYYSVRRFDGKIMKSVDFVAVELEEFIPK